MKGKSDNTLLWIALAVIVAAGFGIIQIPGFFSSIPATQDKTTVLAETCMGGETQSYDPNTYDLYAPSTALTESNNAIRKCGGGWGTFTQGTAITGLETGACYELVYGSSASDTTDNAFGPHVKIDKLPCRVDQSTAVAQDCSASNLASTFRNSNDDASYESLAANEEATVSIRYQAASNTVYGNPFIKDDPYVSNIGNHRKEYPNAFCIQCNTTWCHFTNSRVWIDGGEEMNRITTPTHMAAAAGDVQACWEAPVITETPTTLYFVLDSNGGTAADDATAYLYAGTYYIDSNTGEVMWGNEDTSGAIVGIGTAESTTIDVTA